MFRREFLMGLGLFLALTPILPVAASNSKPIWIIGDSIGVGMGMASGHHYSAVVGTRASDTKAMLKQIAKVPSGVFVVISLGTNDAYGDGVSSHSIIAIKNALKAKNCNFLWVGPPYLPRKSSKGVIVNDYLRQHVDSYLDIVDYTKGLSKYRAGDGVHFSMAGYKKLWAYVEQHL